MTITSEMTAPIGAALGFFFTLALLSYLLGDNPLYRLALHIFIGVAVGWALLVVIDHVLLPRLVTPLQSGTDTERLFTLVPLLLFVFLVLKISPKLSALGNISMAYMVGVGTGVAVGGAITGTLLPQIASTWLSLNPLGSGGLWLDNLVVVIGTITTLLYFQFWLQAQPSGAPERAAPMRILAGVGQGFVTVTLGVIYGGMILSGIAVLSQQVAAIWAFILQFIR